MSHGTITRARKVVVEGQTFFYALRDYQSVPPLTFQAQLHRLPQYSLWIDFPYVGDNYSGNALLQGLPLAPEHPERSRINLHTPSLAAQLILYGLQAGWQPQQARTHFKDGLEVLRALGYVVPLGNNGKSDFRKVSGEV